MPLRACPECSTGLSTTAIACPKCGHSFWAPHFLRFALLICGLGTCLCSGLILYLLARHPIGLGPFTHWPRSEFTGFLLDLRLAAFGGIAFGVITMIGGYLLLRHRNSRR